MTSRAHPHLTGLVAAVLLAGALLAACSSEPVSEATEESQPPVPAQESASAGVASPAASGAAESPTASKPPATPVPADAPPPKPGHPTFKLVKETPGKTKGTFVDEYRITWTSPKGVADSFLIYGLPQCLREAKKYDGKPCVVRGMRIPAEDLVLLTAVPGDQRSATVSWEVGEIDVPPYSAILMRATNSAGNSIFTIVHSEKVCIGCTY